MKLYEIDFYKDTYINDFIINLSVVQNSSDVVQKHPICTTEQKKLKLWQQ